MCIRECAQICAVKTGRTPAGRGSAASRNLCVSLAICVWNSRLSMVGPGSYSVLYSSILGPTFLFPSIVPHYYSNICVGGVVFKSSLVAAFVRCYVLI